MNRPQRHHLDAALWKRVWRDIGRRARRGQPTPRPDRLVIDDARRIAEFIAHGRVVARYRFARNGSERDRFTIEPVDDAELPRLLASSAA